MGLRDFRSCHLYSRHERPPFGVRVGAYHTPTLHDATAAVIADTKARGHFELFVLGSLVALGYYLVGPGIVDRSPDTYH